jgi:hypothetical protein
MRPLFLLLVLIVARPGDAALIPAGTPLEARLESSVNTSSSRAGDVVTAVVSKPIQAEGEAVIPQGSRLNGRVETVTPATPSNEGRVRLAFREIEFPDGRRTPAWITEAFSASPPKRKLRYALFMAVGALGGGLIGGRSARTAGVIGGALTGFVLADRSADGNLPDLTLKQGRTLHLQLGEDLMLE